LEKKFSIITTAPIHIKRWHNRSNKEDSAFLYEAGNGKKPIENGNARAVYGDTVVSAME